MRTGGFLQVSSFHTGSDAPLKKGLYLVNSLVFSYCNKVKINVKIVWFENVVSCFIWGIVFFLLGMGVGFYMGNGYSRIFCMALGGGLRRGLFLRIFCISR